MILQHKPVFYLTHTKNRVIDTIFITHRIDYTSDVVQFLFILGLSPLVLSIRKELRVIFDGVIIDVKKILDIVEPDDIVLLLGKRLYARKQKNYQLF